MSSLCFLIVVIILLNIIVGYLIVVGVLGPGYNPSFNTINPDHITDKFTKPIP